MQKLSILIPAYNEANTIHLILDRIKEVELIGSYGKEIIVVDDCSSDGTVDEVQKYMESNKELDIQLFRQERNRGKGAAIHKAISLASGDY